MEAERPEFEFWIYPFEQDFISKFQYTFSVPAGKLVTSKAKAFAAGGQRCI